MFKDNLALHEGVSGSNYGGAIYNSGTIQFNKDASFIGNMAKSGQYRSAYGGAIYNDENIIFNYLNDFLSGGLTKLITYSLDDVIKLGNYEALFPFRASDKEISAFYIINEIEEIICYTSSGAFGAETKIVASEMISNCDTLILGRHGENYSNYRFILEYPNIEKIILSSNNLTIPKDVREYYGNSNIIESTERISFKH
jgi:hypothetical protein